MRDCGPACQTYAAITLITNRETFVSVKQIAEWARLPVATVRKHIRTLGAAGYIFNAGRQRTRNGSLRRSATIKVIKSAISSDYGFLPWWACCHIGRVGRLPWASKAVLSVVMGQLCKLKGAVEQDGSDATEYENDDSLNDMFFNNKRFQFSLDKLKEITALDRKTIVLAKKHLCKMQIISWGGGRSVENGDVCDTLAPNYDFRVVVTDVGNGKCTIGFMVKK